MLVFGCLGNQVQPGVWEKTLMWLESVGLSQNALFFTLVLMSMAVMKTYVLRKVGQNESAKSFNIAWGGTVIALSLAAWCFGKHGVENTHALLAFCSGSALVDFVLIRYFGQSLSSLKSAGIALGQNVLTTGWLIWLDVPSHYVYAWRHTTRICGW